MKHWNQLAGLAAMGSGMLLWGCKSTQSTAVLRDAGPSATLGACANVLEDMSGRGLAPGDIAANNDPFAKLVLPAQGTCPTSFRSVMDLLRTTDTQSCAATGDGSSTVSGVSVAMVSELAFFKESPVGVRPIITRQCGGRHVGDLFFSPLTFDMNAPLADAVEIIGFDSAAQLFNYYAVENGKIRYFGNSEDLLKGPDASAQFPDQPRRCANCHTSGGLVMKELNSIWANWEGTPIGLEFPNADDVSLAVSVKLGLSSGDANATDVLESPKLETIVESGNGSWVSTKVAFLKGQGDLQGLLRPLFCTQEINLETNSLGLSSSPTTPIAVSDDFLFNGNLVDERPATFELPVAPYQAAILKHQVMKTDDGQSLTDKQGVAQHDTFIGFIFPTASDIDRQTAKELVKQGVISGDFMAAVLATDMSRPVFSAARCDLLKYAPAVDLTAANAAQQVADGFSAAIAADNQHSAAAGELLGNLKSTAVAIAKRAAEFQTACDRRAQSDPQGLVNDVLTVVSSTRAAARNLPVVEHASLMPQDDFGASADAELDPATCLLKQAIASNGQP